MCCSCASKFRWPANKSVKKGKDMAEVAIGSGQHTCLYPSFSLCTAVHLHGFSVVHIRGQQKSKQQSSCHEQILDLLFSSGSSQSDEMANWQSLRSAGLQQPALVIPLSAKMQQKSVAYAIEI